MSQALYVAWRGGEAKSGHWGPVGRLDFEDGFYRFTYTQGARSLSGFTPFSGMNDLQQVYESSELFPLFANRLLSRSRPEYEAYLQWSGFALDNPPDPIAILGVTEGRRATDSVEVFPCPAPDSQGCFINKFFLHGLRWMSPEVQAMVAQLAPGDPLSLQLEQGNPHDPLAVSVAGDQSGQPQRLGYVPRYLAQDVCKVFTHCEPDFISLTVERLNLQAPLQQRLLCRLSACWPPDFQPCAGPEFQPIARVMAALHA
jgi:hypothetical protein